MCDPFSAGIGLAAAAAASEEAQQADVNSEMGKNTAAYQQQYSSIMQPEEAYQNQIIGQQQNLVNNAVQNQSIGTQQQQNQALAGNLFKAYSGATTPGGTSQTTTGQASPTVQSTNVGPAAAATAGGTPGFVQNAYNQAAANTAGYLNSEAYAKAQLDANANQNVANQLSVANTGRQVGVLGTEYNNSLNEANAQLGYATQEYQNNQKNAQNQDQIFGDIGQVASIGSQAASAYGTQSAIQNASALNGTGPYGSSIGTYSTVPSIASGNNINMVDPTFGAVED